MTDTIIKPDIRAAADFCLTLQQINLTAIHPIATETVQYGEGRPFTRKIIRGKSFLHEDADKIEEWLTLAQSKGFGIYWNPNHLNIQLDKYHKKAKEHDVDELLMLHLDLDDPKNITDKRRIPNAHKATLKRLMESPVPPASLIIDSGNGYGAFWTMNPPIKVTDDNRRELKSRNKFLREVFEADPCENLDRVMRLPGTVNHPDLAKIKRGRVPVLARVVVDNRDDPLSEYLLSEFQMSRELPAVTSFSGDAYEAIGEPEIGNSKELIKTKAFWALDTDMKERILTEEIPIGERSEAVFGVCCELRRRGWSDGEIISIIVDPDLAISGHILDQKQRTPEHQAARMIVAMNQKGVMPYLEEAQQEFSDDQET